MLPSIPNVSTTLASLLLLASFSQAVSFDCKNVQAEKKKWDLSKLGGPHSILVQDTAAHPAMRNTTWSIDICKPLQKPSGLPKGDSCPAYTRVCGIVQTWNPLDDPDAEHPIISDVIPVAGEFKLAHGGALDPRITYLKKTDEESESIDIELHGGRNNDRKQKAIVNILCDPDWTGNEGSEQDKRRKRADDSDDDDDDDNGSVPGDRFKQDAKNALQMVSYVEEVQGKEVVDVLRLSWKSKYACEKYEEGDDDEPSNKTAGWGFFTWFIIIFFMATAAYLIFGSWLNYNRYGARGWDLLPHGDTIRDIPYLFKDWSRKVVDTVTGSHSRGGYSAV